MIARVAVACALLLSCSSQTDRQYAIDAWPDECHDFPTLTDCLNFPDYCGDAGPDWHCEE